MSKDSPLTRARSEILFYKMPLFQTVVSILRSAKTWMSHEAFWSIRRDPWENERNHAALSLKKIAQKIYTLNVFQQGQCNTLIYWIVLSFFNVDKQQRCNDSLCYDTVSLLENTFFIFSYCIFYIYLIN